MFRATVAATASATAGGLALVAAGAGAIPVAGVLVLIMVVVMIDARRWAGLAGRSRVGARSEEQVRCALAGLEAEEWRLRHSLPYRGHGDIDSVAIAPTGLAFAIETKTRTFDARRLAGVREMALWLYRRRRRWCRHSRSEPYGVPIPPPSQLRRRTRGRRPRGRGCSGASA